MPAFLLKRFVAAVITIAVTACGPHADLPPPPAIDVTLYPPAIRTQLSDAHATVESKPRSAAANGTMAMLLHTYDLAASASTYYERAALLDDDEFRWPYLLAWVQSAQGLNNEALATLRAAEALDPDYARGRIRIAELLLELGQLENCRQELASLMTEFPGRPEAHFLMAQLENREGRPAQAITAFEKVWSITGDFGALHYGMAQAYRQLGDNFAAARHTTLYEQHKNTTANIDDPVLAQVESLNISETELIERAKAFAQRGDNTTAEQLLNQALVTNPESFAAHITLVGLYATRNQFAKADAQLDIARSLDPGHPTLFYNTGIARFAEERWVEAERAFRRCLEIDPNKADAYAQLGLIAETRGRTEPALRNYRRALAIDPWHRQANWLLGRLLLAGGDAVAAIASLEKVRSARDPSAPGILMDLANAYARNGQTQQAQVAAEDALVIAQRYQDARIVNLANGLLRRLERERIAEPSS